MNLESIEAKASDNLRHTYLSLGLSLPGSRLIQEDGFKACVGVQNHPICNFALDLKLDPWVVRSLSRLAAHHASFRIYLSPSDRPNHAEELVCRSGFQETYALAVLVSGGADRQVQLPIKKVHTVDDRRQVAEFMAAQFFNLHQPEFRNTIAEATFLAEDLDLYRVGDEGRPQAAFMLSGIGDTLGLYNLCVSARSRRRGLGAKLLDWCKNAALSENRSLILQCDTSLESWYSRNGFRSLGQIRVFSLPNALSTDIITTGSLLSRA